MSALINKIKHGLELHTTGDHEAAERIYLDILKEDPDSAEAHHLLASLLMDYNLAKALNHANYAIALQKNANFLNTRGRIFVALQRHEDAINDFRASIKLNPHSTQAYSNLCVAYRHLKDYKNAIKYGKHAISLDGNSANAWLNLGAAQQDLGMYQEALASYQQSKQITLSPLAMANIGKLQYQQGAFSDAIQSFTALYNLGADDLEVRFAHAHALLKLGRTSEAAQTLTSGLNLTFNQSDLLRLIGQAPFFALVVEVATHYSKTLRLPDEAVSIYQKCLAVAPQSAELWNNLGSVYFLHQRTVEAEPCFAEAIKINPNLVWGHTNLGVCHIDKGNSSKAIECFERALSLDSNFPPALGWLLQEKTYNCEWTGFTNLRDQVDALRLTDNVTPISPFVALSVYDNPEALLYWAKLSAQEIFLGGQEKLFRKNSNKKIRLAYYSYDFRNHPVSHLIARVLELHDRSQFEIYLYSYGPDDKSKIRQRVKMAADHFIDVSELSIIDSAKRIAADEIDILIDLTGNTRHNRSGIMSYRPAKIQAHWLGFVGTMGTSYYDYIFADDYVIPHTAEKFYSEAVLRLPSGMHVLDEVRDFSKLALTREQFGLPENGFVFGCFCQIFKIQPEMFASWMTILNAVPDAVLWIASGKPEAEHNLKQTAKQFGVSEDRIIFATRCDIEEYLARFNLIDICLDTFPYTSGTVASDALISGCPLLALSGKTMVSRMSSSILKQAGLEALVCETRAQYEAKAMALASNRSQLLSIKQGLKNKLSQGTLFNMPLAVKQLENLLNEINQ